MKLKKKSKQNVNEEVKVEEPTKKYSDLREVMDMNRPYTMLFSGVEDDNNFQILYDMGINLVFLKESTLNTENFRATQQIASVGNEIADLYIETTNKVLMILAEQQIKKAFEKCS